MPDPLIPDDILSPPADPYPATERPLRLAMAQPPEAPPAGAFPPGKPPPKRELQFLGGGGAPPLPRGQPQGTLKPRVPPAEQGAIPVPRAMIGSRIEAAYRSIVAETGKRIVDAGPLAKRAGVTPQEFAAWADSRSPDIQHLSSTYSKEPKAQRNKLVVPSGEGRANREFYGFTFPVAPRPIETPGSDAF